MFRLAFGVALAIVLALASAGCATSSAPAAPVAVQDETAPEPSADDANAAIAAAVPTTDIYLLPLAPLVRGQVSVKAVTQRSGYDNQPAFSADGRYLWFASIRDGQQADIFRYTIDTGQTRQITTTAQSEYSPTPLAGGGFSCVQVALDGTQRLWRYDDTGTATRAVRGDITGVGYHAWLGPERLALFIVGEPHRLVLADPGGDHSTQIAVNPGRALHHVGGGRLGYVDKGTEPWVLRVYDPASGAQERRAAMFPEVEDLAWLEDGTALAANGRSIFALDPDASEWRELADLARAVTGDIGRMAVDPSGRWLAVVVSREPD